MPLANTAGVGRYDPTTRCTPRTRWHTVAVLGEHGYDPGSRDLIAQALSASAGNSDEQQVLNLPCPPFTMGFVEEYLSSSPETRDLSGSAAGLMQKRRPARQAGYHDSCSADEIGRASATWFRGTGRVATAAARLDVVRRSACISAASPTQFARRWKFSAPARNAHAEPPRCRKSGRRLLISAHVHTALDNDEMRNTTSLPGSYCCPLSRPRTCHRLAGARHRTESLPPGWCGTNCAHRAA